MVPLRRSSLRKTAMVLISLCAIANQSHGSIRCPATGSTQPPGEAESVFDFGNPAMFVTTYSQDFNPYSLVDHHRRTSILEEYLMVGYHAKGHHKDHKHEDGTKLHERLQMLFYDGVKSTTTKATESPDLVRQNLEKELYWRYFNSTGIYPSMTIVNTTKKVTIRFHSHKPSFSSKFVDVDDDELEEDPTKGELPSPVDKLSFDAIISAREYFKEPQVPSTAIFEIPANSRVLRNEKTMIQYQTFSLWRWRLSEKVVEWSEILAVSDPYINNSLTSNFHRVDNPCIKDMFLLYVPRTEKGGGPDDKLVYLASPLIQAHFRENWFYDLKTADHPWWPDAPDALVLTNDHLVVLTQHSMWISTSLNDSTYPGIDLEMPRNKTYDSKPVLPYSRVNPCANFEDTMNCFYDKTKNAPPADPDPIIITTHRLFYNPVCYLYQFPNYDDYLIFLVTRERLFKAHPTSPLKDFTVLFAAKPYEKWRVLFSNLAFYKVFNDPALDTRHYELVDHVPINDIIGIFFNHHVRQFDITLELGESKPYTYMRFALPEPDLLFDGYDELLTDEQQAHHLLPGIKDLRLRLTQLNGTRGDGFPDYAFPDENFELREVVVNGDTLDVFFIGNQLWIAEAAGPKVYAAIRGITSVKKTACDKYSTPDTPSFIRECSINHPDKTYLCMNQDRHLILAGKIGSRYTPSVILVESIDELVRAQKINPWVSDYFCTLVQERSVFTTAFSGRILFWYLHVPEDEVNTAQAAINAGCTAAQTDLPILCDEINKWSGCTAEPSGKAGFRLVAMDPTKFRARRESTDGPLAPFILDSNTVILYEGIVPKEDSRISPDYMSAVFVGQKIFCPNYELQKGEENDVYQQHTCELFIRHIKPIDNFLDGFRLIVYATVVKSIPLVYVPADIVVLTMPDSNQALVKVNDYMNNPPWVFTENHIGQTLYSPGDFSILLTNFPVANDSTIMEGYTTRHFQRQRRFLFRALYTFMMDLSTDLYRKNQISNQGKVQTDTAKMWSDITEQRKKEVKAEEDMRQRIDNRWMDSDFAPTTPQSLFQYLVSPYMDREQEILELLNVTQDEINKNLERLPLNMTPVAPPTNLAYPPVDYKDRLIWYVDETGECNYILTLVNNPVLKASGGRISLDLYDRISFEVLLRPLTPLAEILMYRPLIIVTNSNPSVLRIEVIEKLKGNPQYIEFLVSPTGFRQGISVITVRTRVSSLHCEQSSSITLIVLCHRDVGRRLHVNYPIPTCRPQEEIGMYPRPWYQESEGCITSEELLNPKKSEIIRYRAERKIVVYISLPPNYRPPSFDGEDVPQTRNVYNADPSKRAYKAWYKISRETIQLDRCAGKSAKSECDCSDVDRLLDDEELTECKEKVFFTKRTGTGEPITMSITYDRIMEDKDQNPGLFLPKRNWSITIEEVNARGEWYVTSEHTPYLRMINADPELHRGRRYYDMNKFQVTLLGTGLFHFRAKLGNLESFGPVNGYFMLFVSTDDLNHVHLFMILLGTIITCMTLVFIGFLINRKRLSSMLPIQPMSNKRKLKLL